MTRRAPSVAHTQVHALHHKHSMRVAAGLVVLSPLIAEPGPAQDVSPKATNVSIQLSGISASFPVSSISHLRWAVPASSVFYLGKTVVGGELILLFPKNTIVEENWLSGFQFTGVYRHTHFPDHLEEIPAKDLKLTWANPVSSVPPDGSTIVTAAFTLKTAGDKDLDPGIYMFRWSGIEKPASFVAEKANDNTWFVVSRLETREDLLNWYEFLGDSARAAQFPTQLPLEELGNRQQESRRAAQTAYEQFLGLKPDDDVVLLKLAETFEMLSLYREAIVQYTRVLRVWDDNKGLKRVVGWQGLWVRQDKWTAFRRAVSEHVERLKGFADRNKVPRR